jgi:hypothetical protein
MENFARDQLRGTESGEVDPPARELFFHQPPRHLTWQFLRGWLRLFAFIPIDSSAIPS